MNRIRTRIFNKNSLGVVYRLYHEVTGDVICPSMVQGIDHIRDARLNKGLGFTIEERQALGIHGLMPPCFKTQEQQLDVCWFSVMKYQDRLNKFVYLSELQDRNERLFFRLLSEHVEELMPIVYTPTVGEACLKFGVIYRRPRGLFITIHDKGHVFDILKNWPEPNVRAIVVTDGERILGLGDLGACGMGIPVGKLALYTALAGMKPHQCLPITLDVGTNNEKLLEDPCYIGLRQKRVTGPVYDEFVEEFMTSVVKRYGQNTLIQFEDFANHNAFRFLEKYRNKYCTFNDDIQGTAAIAVAGLLALNKITGKRLSDNKFMFFGAGGAAIGIADMFTTAMVAEGTTIEEARDKIWMMDIDGLLTKDRPEGNLEGHKAHYAKDHEVTRNLLEIVNELKPSVLIGASAKAKAFTPEVLRAMGDINERPVIFALSNPTEKSECTAEEAYIHTEGRCIFSSGSPFLPVKLNGHTYRPGQSNNAYIFPGVALGVIAAGIHHVTDELFLLAAHIVADFVTNEDIESGRVYPPLIKLKDCSFEIAVKILEFAYKNGIASVYPEPSDYKALIRDQMYDYNYDCPLPVTYPWPEEEKKPIKSIFELTGEHLKKVE